MPCNLGLPFLGELSREFSQNTNVKTVLRLGVIGLLSFHHHLPRFVRCSQHWRGPPLLDYSSPPVWFYGV